MWRLPSFPWCNTSLSPNIRVMNLQKRVVQSLPLYQAHLKHGRRIVEVIKYDDCAEAIRQLRAEVEDEANRCLHRCNRNHQVTNGPVGSMVVGFDTETKPFYGVGLQQPMALVQIATLST